MHRRFPNTLFPDPTPGRRWLAACGLLALAALARVDAAEPTAEALRALAREAYTYAFPMVEGYKTFHKQALDPKGSDYKAPLNRIGHSRTVATPADRFVVTPNSDTPYSYAWLDLRSEPVVLTMPKIEANRYYSAQLVDLYTHNFAYLGTRTHGNEGGDFLVVGPSWKGEKPAGIRAVLACETEILYVIFRTQLFDSKDLERVHRIQDGYTVRPLSAFLGRPPAPAAPAITWPPLADRMSESAEIFEYLNFLLRFCPTVAAERDLMQRFATLNVGADRAFRATTLTSDTRKAIEAGIETVWKQDFATLMGRINAGAVGSGDLFGTRDFLNGNYLYRFAGAKLGLYGNSREEAVYPTYFVDSEKQKLDASKHRYTLRFEKGKLPPANAFWSLTMYDGTTQFLVSNPIQRYLLNSTMLDTFRFGPDGSLTLYLQKDAPGPDHAPNWLPAPDGPFYAILRVYMPKAEILDGSWKQPALRRVEGPSNLP
ncbi:MAG: DUF1254 domain-containing protein [Verrucomicrobiales bacterium]|nr:DUF1254 domain-containing protein [Verrucomicrobiales bacterium]